MAGYQYFHVSKMATSWKSGGASSSRKSNSNVKSIPVAEMDVDLLFEKHSIDEIRAIEKRTRANIEHKKEELRLMVGERYRDLIEAADTITEMNTSSTNVLNSISRMQDYCKQLSESHLVRGVAFNKAAMVQKRKKNNQFFAIATQIKLLLDTPEKIWSAIDENDYLRATQLYLLAKHIHTQLYTDPKLLTKIDQLFPVLPRQWAAISHFKTTILNGCRASLKNTSLSEKCICDSLCAIVLLEDSNPRQVFNEFLMARTHIVQQYFHPDQQLSIKDQICEIVRLITSTVHQIYALFYDGHDLLQDEKMKEVNLLKQTLERVTDKDTAELIVGGGEAVTVWSHVPVSVREYRPTLSTSTLSIPQDQVQEKCQHWLETCSQGISTGIGKLLQYVTSVKHLASIRDHLWTLLAEDRHAAGGWEEICQHILSGPVHVWDDYFRQIFFQRSKAILQKQFNDAVVEVQTRLDKLLNDVLVSEERYIESERNLSWYIWSESAGDVPPGSAWTTSRSRSLNDGGGLMMKAKAYTISTQSLCKEFDSRLSSLLEDSRHYTELHADDDRPDVTSPFDRCGDAVPVYQFLQDACDDSVNRLLAHISKLLLTSRQQLVTSRSPDQHCRTVDRVLICARLCCAVCDLSPHLHECMVEPTHRERLEAGIRFMKKATTSAKIQLKRHVDDPRFTQLKTRLADKSTEAYKLWNEFTAERWCKVFLASLSDGSEHNLLHHSTRWDEVVIQEETEEGQTIHSTIRVPMQPSSHIHTLLYGVCTEINRVAGHSIKRFILEDLVEQLTQGVVSAYEELMTNAATSSVSGHQAALTQNRALQLIFDVKYLSGILARKVTDNNSNSDLPSRLQAIQNDLETRVDPFDLDVFMPYISAHLNKHSHRASVLYGALISPDKLPTAPPSRSSASSGSQEQHNILPLSSVQTRFTLLPINSQQMRQVNNDAVTTQVQAKPNVVTGALDRLDRLSADKQSPASFYNRIGSMSTIWFSNISGTSKS